MTHRSLLKRRRRGQTRRQRKARKHWSARDIARIKQEARALFGALMSEPKRVPQQTEASREWGRRFEASVTVKVSGDFWKALALDSRPVLYVGGKAVATVDHYERVEDGSVEVHGELIDPASTGEARAPGATNAEGS